MKVKTDQLTDAVLDWAVAKCIGETEEETLDPLTWLHTAKPTGCWDFSTKWSQGGPIIERERMTIALDACGWEARCYDGEAEPWVFTGPTPLVAAMRCYVASKMGDQVELPDELAQCMATTP